MAIEGLLTFPSSFTDYGEELAQALALRRMPGSGQKPLRSRQCNRRCRDCYSKPGL